MRNIMSDMKRLALLVLLAAGPILAETNEIRCAQQYGTSYLALMIMQDQKLIEKHAKQAGLGDVKVTWAKLGGPGAMKPNRNPRRRSCAGCWSRRELRTVWPGGRIRPTCCRSAESQSLSAKKMPKRREF